MYVCLCNPMILLYVLMEPTPPWLLIPGSPHPIPFGLWGAVSFLFFGGLSFSFFLFPAVAAQSLQGYRLRGM